MTRSYVQYRHLPFERNDATLHIPTGNAFVCERLSSTIALRMRQVPLTLSIVVLASAGARD
ncbi:hypothetical protein BDZ90DRAFT_169400 [Jaminaea rosea]|uniref:Uncharacterized protein n=1 Tax=Jaminaea rosea TaxID=1569628 RepID=A0A316URS6_9BASI|nr:hypothetical protein BDZ90DRAFT_169400 [Jaminaea rosea]PWN27684.1 hypothetical protein BDZ90DRAFT_169400 [Jaminaea rosea]